MNVWMNEQYPWKIKREEKALLGHRQAKKHKINPLKKSWRCLVHRWKGVHVNFTGRVCPSIAFTRPTVLRYANKEIPRGSDRQQTKDSLKDHMLS